ncbi:Transposase, IS4 family [Escherichia coli]|nr:Transposase, IS4 family [Escherichia coli]
MSKKKISVENEEFITYRALLLSIDFVKEGANKQVISSQVDSLIKISRIWANFFPANTSNQPI